MDGRMTYPDHTAARDHYQTLAEAAQAVSMLLTIVTAHPALASESSSETTAVDAPEQPVDSGWPIGGPLGQRIYCIEGMESRHGAAMWNPTPVWNGEHAQGYLGFLPSTARAWGVVIGNRASEWAGAAAMIRAGAGAQFAGIAWGQC